MGFFRRKPHEHDLFERRVGIHADSAYNLARWLLGNEEDAKDVLQDALLSAYRSMHQLVSDDGKTWLLTIVRNRCYKILRKPPLLELDDAEPSPIRLEEQVMSSLSLENINIALEQLAESHREILILREMEDMPYSEIATVLGIPVGTVMSRLARARAALALSLEKEEVL